MKTPFQPSGSRVSFFRTPRRIGTTALVVLIGLILIVRFAIPMLLPMLATPLWQFGGAISHFFSFGGGNASLEIEKLTQEKNELQSENEALKARLLDAGALQGTPSGIGMLAGVLVGPPISPYDTLVIAAGKNQGVSAGSMVYAESVPIGKIVSVNAVSSTALLFSSAGEVHEGWIGDARHPVILSGTGGGTFSAQVPRDEGVQVGDAVYIPGPGALPVGVVAQVDQSASSPKSVLHIRPNVNVFSLTFVRVTTGAQ